MAQAVDVEVGRLTAGEIEAAGGLLHEAARAHYPSARDAASEIAAWRKLEPEGTLVARRDGKLAGVACARRIGDVAVVGPLAAVPMGSGVGGALLDQLCHLA